LKVQSIDPIPACADGSPMSITVSSGFPEWPIPQRPIEVGRPRRRWGGHTRFSYVPIVRYRYEAEGRQFAGASIFPDPFRIGGNLGYLAAKAPLDCFKVGLGIGTLWRDAMHRACGR
jgi:hypothetical protein